MSPLPLGVLQGNMLHMAAPRPDPLGLDDTASLFLWLCAAPCQMGWLKWSMYGDLKLTMVDSKTPHVLDTMIQKWRLYFFLSKFGLDAIIFYNHLTHLQWPYWGSWGRERTGRPCIPLSRLHPGRFRGPATSLALTAPSAHLQVW